MDENLKKAADLAHWLITKKGVSSKTAYIIARNKYKLPDYNIIRKARQKLKPKQHRLI